MEIKIYAVGYHGYPRATADMDIWISRDNKKLVAMAVARASLLEPLYLIKMDITRKGLVIGGGVSGMVSALSLADQGFEVELVERESELGGNARHLHFTLEGDDPQIYLKFLVEKVTSHKLINVHLLSEIKKMSGHIGHFISEVKSQKSEVKKIEHGVVIVATGGVEYQPAEYLYGENERVITQRQLEEYLSNLSNPKSEIQNLKSIVMIQCVGSRSNERPYCSRVCCSQAIKNALKIKEINPETQIYILYRDIRTYGFRKDYYRQAREAGVIFIRYDENSKPEVRKVEQASCLPSQTEDKGQKS
ncbi:MAG: FAD-dependent oxidoreductase [bacterium]